MSTHRHKRRCCLDANASFTGAERTRFAEIFLQPAAVNVGPPLRSKWGGRKRNYLPHACAAHSSGAQIQRPLISGSQVRALVRPISSPPKLVVEDQPAERPIFVPVFRDRDGGSCVSAHRSCLLGSFGAPVSDDKNPVPGGSLGGGRSKGTCLGGLLAAMAREELGHVSTLRKERGRAYHREHGRKDADGLTRVAPSQVDARRLELRLTAHLADAERCLQGRRRRVRASFSTRRWRWPIEPAVSTASPAPLNSGTPKSSPRPWPTLTSKELSARTMPSASKSCSDLPRGRF
jgi:hypothetical protein